MNLRKKTPQRRGNARNPDNIAAVSASIAENTNVSSKMT